MATLDEDDRRYLEALLTPMRDDGQRYEEALFGNGHRGLVIEMAELRGFARISAAVSGLVLGLLGFLGVGGHR